MARLWDCHRNHIKLPMRVNTIACRGKNIRTCGFCAYDPCVPVRLQCGNRFRCDAITLCICGCRKSAFYNNFYKIRLCLGCALLRYVQLEWLHIAIIFISTAFNTWKIFQKFINMQAFSRQRQKQTCRSDVTNSWNIPCVTRIATILSKSAARSREPSLCVRIKCKRRTAIGFPRATT